MPSTWTQDPGSPAVPAASRQGLDQDVILAARAWQPAQPRPALQRGQAVPQVIVCGLAQLHAGELQALLPGAQCLVLPGGAGRDLAGRYGDAALACFERVRQVLQGQEPALVQVVAADTPEGAVFAGLAGLLRSAAIENPRIAGQVVLTRPDIGAAELAGQLRAEAAAALDGVVRYGPGTRQVLRLREQEQPRGGQAVRPVFKQQGVYLITGGLGGLGVLFAQEILRQAADAQIVLTGRSAPHAGQRRQLQALCAQGGQVEYRQLDVSDGQAVAQLVRTILGEKGQLNGILHAAGVRSDGFVLKKTAQQFAGVLAPKVAGTQNLDLATRDVDLDFMVLFSSGASVTGNAGQADYAAANGFMDGFAGYRNSLVAAGQRRGRTLAINWPLWQDGGMGVDAEIQAHLAHAFGIRPLATPAGLQVFHEGLHSTACQLLVLAGHAAKLRSAVLAAHAGPARLTDAQMEEQLAALFSLPAP